MDCWSAEGDGGFELILGVGLAFDELCFFHEDVVVLLFVLVVVPFERVFVLLLPGFAGVDVEAAVVFVALV